MSQIRYYPEKTVDGITGWNWIDTDSGAWDGPKMDWENHHKPNIEQFVKNRGIVIQAGGNLGMYPRLLSRMFERVYTFEPDPLNFKTLTLNCDNDNIIKMQAALGKQGGNFCQMERLTMQNVGMHKVKEVDNAIIPILALDEIFTSELKVDLIMLDLEGYELKALIGASGLIYKHKPIIFVERPNNDTDAFLGGFNYSVLANSAMDVVYGFDQSVA